MGRNLQSNAHQMFTKAALKACASLAVLAAFSPAYAVTDFLSFATTGNFTGWTTLGTTSGSSATLKTMTITDQVTLGDGTHGDKIKRPWSLTPATGQSMAKIQPYSSPTYLGAAESVFGLTSGTFASVFSGLSGRPTNYGALTETIALTGGTYTFYWAYAAQDYHPYNDGVLFALSGNGVNKVDVLASNGETDAGGGGAQPETKVVGTFGATQWAAHTFTLASAGTYQLSFVAYNWGPASSLSDTAVNPLLYIGASAGTVTQGSAKPIDTTAAFYSASGLGSTVLPDFKGGTLRVDGSGTINSAFTVESYSGNAIDSYGNAGIFSGVLSGTGGLTLKDSVGGGKVVFTGANTYTGGTIINAGATLQIGNNGTTGTIAGNATDNGTLVFNRSNSITYGGVVSGTGSLIQSGSGTLILTGANTYTGGTTISYGTLQVGNGETTGSIAGDVVNNAALAFNRSDAATFGGAISGTGSLTQAGTGTLTLTGTNTYTGGTTITAGTLQIGDGNTSGSIAGDIANNAALAFNRSDAVTYAGAISGSGSLTQAGNGSLILTGANTYTGGTTISAGTLQIGAGRTTGAVAGDITNNGTLEFNRSDDVQYDNVISGTGRLVKQGAGTLTLTGENHYTGGTVISSGTLEIAGRYVPIPGQGSWMALKNGSIDGDVVNNGVLAFDHRGSFVSGVVFAGAISGSGSLVQRGTDPLYLTGQNTYTGGTTIANYFATLYIGNGGTTGSITGDVINNDGELVFNRSNSFTYGGAISGSGRVSVTGGGTAVLTGANTYTGKTTIVAGSALQIGDGGTTGSIVSDVVNEGALVFKRSDTVTFSGNITGSGSLYQNGTGKVIITTNYTGKALVNSGTLQIGNGGTSGAIAGNIVNNATVVYGQAAATTYTGVISGTGGVSVAGGGVVILNGSNTYTGPTTITAGSLIIGDSTHQSATVLSGVTVSNNAIVGGYGMIGGNLVATGGTVSPGNSIGTLTVNGNYTQSSAATLKIEVTPTAADKLVVNGAAQLGGTLQLSVGAGSYSTRAFSILSAGSISGSFANVSYTGAASDVVYGIVYGSKEVDLAVTPRASGQIYGDIVTQSLDTAVALNRTTLDRLDRATNTGWSAWSKTLAGASRTNGKDGLSDVNTQLWGVISGVDYGFADGAKLSGVFSYTHNQLGVHAESSKASVSGYFFALAGHLPANDLVIDVTGFLQHNDIDVLRSNGTAGNAGGRTSNLVGGGSLGIGYPLEGGDVVPFARLTITGIDTDAFAETGDLGLSVNPLTQTSVRGTWGVAVSHDYTTENGTQITPRFVIGLENEFGQSGRDTAMTFAGTNFLAPAPTPADFSGLFAAGLIAKLDQQLEVSLETTGRLSANQREGIASFGARYRF